MATPIASRIVQTVSTPADFTSIASGTTDVQGINAAVGLRLLGWQITEDAGAPAAARLSLRHGTTATDPEIADIRLAASESKVQWFGDGGIKIPNGVFIDRTAGTTKVKLYTRIEE